MFLSSKQSINRWCRMIKKGWTKPFLENKPQPPEETPLMHTLRQARELAERQAIANALEHTRGNVAATARRLGLTTRALWYALVRLDIKLSQYRDSQTPDEEQK